MPLMDSLLQENLQVEYKKGSSKGQKNQHSYDIIFNEMTSAESIRAIPANI